MIVIYLTKFVSVVSPCENVIVAFVAVSEKSLIVLLFIIETEPY